MRDSDKKDGAVGVISDSERRSIKVMCLLISCFMKMRKFVSVSLTDTHAHGHTLQTPGCVAVCCLFARQPDNIQSAKHFIWKSFLCHVYRRKVK